MPPVAALLLSIAVMLLLIKLLKHAGYAVFSGAVLMSLLTLGATGTLYALFHTITSPATLRLMGILFSVLFLSYSLEKAGILRELALGMKSLAGGFSIVLVPLMIGLLPMPGGALVSAIMLRGIVSEKPEQASFANYWFRHLWIPTWPLYPAFIITMGVLEAGAPQVIMANLPLTLFSLFSGFLLSLPFIFSLKAERCSLNGKFRGALPIAGIAFTTLVLKVDLLYSILIVLAVTLLLLRLSLKELREVAPHALDIRMGVLILGVMLFRYVIEQSGSARAMFELLENMGFPPFVTAMAVSFIIGFAVGIEMAPPGIALPLFTGLIGTGDNLNPEVLLLIFSAGFLGVQLSPMHLCFILTASYFRVSLSRVYRYVIASSILTFFLVVLYVSLH